MTDSQVVNTNETIGSNENHSQLEDNDSICEYTFDDYYLDFFIATDNKSESFKKAAQATGYPLPKYVTQSAYVYHKRLIRDGILDKAIIEATRSDRIASRLKLLTLLDAESESVQFQAAKHMTGSMYEGEATSQGITVNVNRDNVEITHKNQTLTIENDNHSHLDKE